MATKTLGLGDEVYVASRDVRDLRRTAERAGDTAVADLLAEAESLLTEAADMLSDEEDAP